MDTDRSVVTAREKGVGDEYRLAKAGEMGMTETVSTVKQKMNLCMERSLSLDLGIFLINYLIKN